MSCALSIGPGGTGRARTARALAMLLFGTAVPPERPAAAQSCDLYLETFGSFSAPADFDNGAYRVRWCRNGGSVTSTSPCLTGNSFRLNAAGHDPVILLDLPASSGCTQVRLEFQYAQAVATNTVVRFRTGSATPFDCASSITDSIGTLSTTGGACITVQHIVPVGTARFFAWKLDHGANSNAIFIDNVRITLTGCTGGCEPPHDCCEPGSPGCIDPAIMACVCAQDPYCCEVAWDEQCVALVDSLSCGNCGAVQPCLADFTADFGTFFQSGRVCTLFPALFETCEGTGPVISAGGLCGGAGDYAMVFSSGFPYSAAITKCLSLAGDAPVAMTFDYTKNTGTLGPRVEVSVAGGGWSTLWTAPVSFPGGCVPVCLDLSSCRGQPSVRFRFLSASSVSNGAAIDDIRLRRDIACASHEPCTPGPPGTNDPAVTACLCAIDPYCCATEWDDICVILASVLGCTYCPGLCSTEFGENFGDGGVIDPQFSVCELFPGSFAACDPAAPPSASESAPCAGAGDPAMIFAAAAPGAEPSSAISACFDLHDAVLASLRFSFSVPASPSGARIEVSDDLGASWVTVWTSPAVGSAGGSGGCARACIDLSPFAARSAVILRFSAASASPQGVSFDDLQLIRGQRCPDCSTLAGDLDRDGTVGLSDIAIIITNWATAGPTGDADGDGAVGLSDIAILVGGWGARCP